MIRFLMIFLPAFAQSPSESFQLQQLIIRSEKQIELLKELIKTSKQDSAALQRASHALDELTEGIDVSLKKYQGTREYAEAMNRLQAKNNYAGSYKDFQDLQKKNEVPSDDEVAFQINAIRANQQDLARQGELANLLATAPPALVTKIQVESQLGEWEASTRISAQLTELLASIRAIREELRLQRQASTSQVLDLLIQGAEEQADKLNIKERP